MLRSGRIQTRFPCALVLCQDVLSPFSRDLGTAERAFITAIYISQKVDDALMTE